MFGHDDNQQPAQDTNTVMDAAMPEPLGDDNGGSSVPAQPDAVNPSTAPSMSVPPASNPGLSVSSPGLSSSGSSLGDSNGHSGDELLDLKQKALQHLSPLVSQLDQTPEEKFRTTMMMIQASDDKTLVKSAFEAAQAITDDKARAQALLDIINEINYFTQHQQQ